MDSDRAIRYITPTIFFYGNLLLGAWLDNSGRVESLFRDSFPLLAGAAGAALFPIGFIIAGISDLVLRLMFSLTRNPYEAAFDDNTWKRIWRALNFDLPPKKTKINKQSAAQTYDHELLPKGTHACAARLWSAFNIAARSSIALALSVIVGHWLLNIQMSTGWDQFTILLILLFGLIAVITWKRHMAFLTLQTRRIGKSARASSNAEESK
ncbi:MAG: hypothetical protein GY846_25305 [Deltaproteobacteria bacterium]|nr:hypothetical protein [Deltaproteobacteria bacterium]